MLLVIEILNDYYASDFMIYDVDCKENAEQLYLMWMNDVRIILAKEHGILLKQDLQVTEEMSGEMWSNYIQSIQKNQFAKWIEDRFKVKPISAEIIKDHYSGI